MNNIFFGIVAALLIAVIAVLYVYLIRLRRLEKQLTEFRAEIGAQISAFENSTRSDFQKERHMINESLSGISETLMRASMIKKKDVEQAEAPAEKSEQMNAEQMNVEQTEE